MHEPDNQPVVGIVPRNSGPYAPAPPNVLRLIHALGASPLILPHGYSLEGLDGCSGLLLQGGDDVPSLSVALRNDSLSTQRDLAEYAALQRALQLGLGVVGVCRGMQLINQYFGGTDSPLKGKVYGLDHGSSIDWSSHDVYLHPDSFVAQHLGSHLLRSCSSHHSRAIERLGVGVEAFGWAHDGCIEAIQQTGRRILGIQWHPEDSTTHDPIQLRLLQMFLANP